MSVFRRNNPDWVAGIPDSKKREKDRERRFAEKQKRLSGPCKTVYDREHGRGALPPNLAGLVDQPAVNPKRPTCPRIDHRSHKPARRPKDESRSVPRPSSAAPSSLTREQQTICDAVRNSGTESSLKGSCVRGNGKDEYVGRDS